jgi:anti-sigma factor RsiW
MSCEYNQERLESYALGILDEKDQQKVTAHVQSCNSCRSQLASLRQATRMLKDAFDEEPPSWLTQKTMSVLKIKPNRTFPSWFSWGVPALAGVAAVVMVLLIQPGIILKPNVPSGALRSSQAVDQLAQQQNEENASPASIAVATNHKLPDAFVDITDELTVTLKNPAYDRSIYDDLGVKKEVAKLLL